MFNFFDKKQFFTLVLAGIALFLLQKYMTKKVTTAGGEVKQFIGNDELGVI